MLSKSNFNLRDPYVLLRIMLGLFQIPHTSVKYTDFERVVGSFTKIGFYPPKFWLLLAIIAETACAIGLIFGIYTKWSATLSAAFMLVVIGATLKTAGMVWLWNFGGIEFSVMWLIVSLAVAMQAAREEQGKAFK